MVVGLDFGRILVNLLGKMTLFWSLMISFTCVMPIMKAESHYKPDSVGLSGELAIIGLGGGVHVEGFWPLFKDRHFFARFGLSGLYGPELIQIPINIAIQWNYLQTDSFVLGIGLGPKFQNFFPNYHNYVSRLDLTLDMVFGFRVSKDFLLKLVLGPEFGFIGGFGLGLPIQLGLQFDSNLFIDERKQLKDDSI